MNAEGSPETSRVVAASGREPIAIVGIGCRFPKADGPQAFWELLRNGVDAIDELPPERFRIPILYKKTYFTYSLMVMY